MFYYPVEEMRKDLVSEMDWYRAQGMTREEALEELMRRHQISLSELVEEVWETGTERFQFE